MTRLCNCSRRVEHKFRLDCNKTHITKESCETCGGRFIIDGIEHASSGILSTTGLEIMSTINPELNWKTITKGRRSRKSITRNVNGIEKMRNTSPEQCGDYSGSDSDKVGQMFPGEPAPAKEEYVPIKKRKHFLRSPSPQPCFSSLCHQETSSIHVYPSSPYSKDQDLVPKPGNSSDQAPRGYYLHGDFSGIELLAAAASMDVDVVNEDHVVEDSSMPEHLDRSGFAKPSEQDFKFNGSGNFLSNSKTQEDKADCTLSLSNSIDASQGLCGSPRVQIPTRSLHLKKDRRHWDLNIVMDAWDVPYDDNIPEHSSKDISETYIDYTKETARVQMLYNAIDAGVESSCVKSDATKLKRVSPDRTCMELASTQPNGYLHKEIKHVHNNSGREKSDQAIEKDADKNNKFTVVSGGPDFETSVPVMNIGAALGSSTKLDSSNILTSKEKSSTVSGGGVHLTGDEGNVVEEGRITASDKIETPDQDGSGHDNQPEPCQDVSEHNDLRDIEMSRSAINVQNKDVGDPQPASKRPGNTNPSRKTFVKFERLDADNFENDLVETNYFNTPSNFGNSIFPGMLNQDDQTVTAADCNVGSDEADGKGQLELAELIAKCENSILPNEESQTFSTGAQSDEPTTSVGKVGSTVDNHRGLDVTPGNHGDMVEGDNLNRFQDGYDSPYEDGELRGLCLYSWDENESGNKCVDYESDGRNGEGSDAADYPGSEIVQGGSESSHNIKKRVLSVRRFSEGYESKSGLVKGSNSYRKDFMRDDPDNVIGGKKDSNGGSGTTVEQSTEMATQENDSVVRIKYLSYRRDITNGNFAHGEYSSRMCRGALQSRTEGRSEPTDGKDGFFIQQCRTRRFGGSYSRPERDFSPEKYTSRYRAGTHMDKRDDIDQWPYWGSRNRYTSSSEGVEFRNQGRPRSLNGDSGLDFQDRTNNFSKSFRRPFVSRRSPMDRDDGFSFRRRGTLARGISSYRNRGHFSRGANREFEEDFNSIPDDTAASVRLSRYFSGKDRSFSPGSGSAGAHLPLIRNRSRSRSRTRSPKPWHKERYFINRRQSRSPDFRSEARTRAPFSKPSFTSDYGEGYMSPPPRGRFSQHSRGGGRSFAGDNNLRRRRSPDFRRSQRFDVAGSYGRLKSDEYLRHMMRPARFTFMNNDGPDDNDNNRESNGEAVK